ncbi:hypothetical protein CAXC1_150016 [Candidatus Xenohaliotis californiensis]|uniref:Uncharacterized protein n=1 Tax=Candidatus Xenohaliotis californiensis TaxID=84677 RepID=A0ABM9N772_9RICK|nr:hypothetical protein CAXC1_150016 [Candidatus Xenohaliotis californiensis]
MNLKNFLKNLLTILIILLVKKGIKGIRYARLFKNGEITALSQQVSKKI